MFNTRYVGLNQPPILQSIVYLVTSGNMWELGRRRIHLIRCTWHFKIATKNHHQQFKYKLPICQPENFQACLALHPARPRITLVLCFPVIQYHFLLYLPLYTSLYITNFTSSKKEPTAGPMRNHYSQKNQEEHLGRALARALQKTANLHCQSNVWTSN